MKRFRLIEDLETPKNLVGRNRVVKLAYALFGRAANPPYRGGKDARLKAPFTVHRDELGTYDFADLRIGAFGPLFGGALLLGVALLGVQAVRGRQREGGALLWIGAAVVSASMNSEAWWSRYAPQVWWVPILCALPAAERCRDRVTRAGLIALAGLLVADVVIVGGGAATFAARAGAALEADIARLRVARTVRLDPFNFGSLRVRLREAGVRFEEARNPACAMPFRITSVNRDYPPGVKICAE